MPEPVLCICTPWSIASFTICYSVEMWVPGELLNVYVFRADTYSYSYGAVTFIPERTVRIGHGVCHSFIHKCYICGLRFATVLHSKENLSV